MTTVTCYLGLGSNIETAASTRYDFLSFAVRQLAQHASISVLDVSHVYETAPVGYDTQENFYNAVMSISTSLSPQELLRVCLDVVEKRAGRQRTIANGPRTLDVDILLFGDKQVHDDNLVIPHPRMNERAFVMVPLSEIAPQLVGDLSQYSFVDSVKDVVRTELDFTSIIANFAEEA